ncbi:tetratricopeptide repeat protein [Rhodococcus sp. X156]|uniref:tetratricopeptide repeat protein n=1 Tax=Rhodococcus sp. X156 TaxID=2499145 RepID=UPI001F49DAE9|nr:tetratricopeptide repeat protein [Rhodococcus sp. X156]
MGNTPDSSGRRSFDGPRGGRDRSTSGRPTGSGGARHDRGARPRPGSGSDERRTPRPPEPPLPEDVDVKLLDPDVRRDLLSLDKSNAEKVAMHLVMAGTLVDEDPERALLHARAARGRAGRVAVVREAAGIAAYHAGEWAEAIAELRAARRMAGGPGLVAVLADCERALGRPERALELARSDEARQLTGEAAEELRIVAAGARRDLGQLDAAVVMLQTPELDPTRTGSAAARLFYAYADALLAAGRTDDAIRWFMQAATADEDGETDAEDRAAALGAGGEGAGSGEKIGDLEGDEDQ